MPLVPPPPELDRRRFPELVAEMLARVPVHTPEWTATSPADPGVTLLHLFAHVTESLLYRAALIPERNRQKFLALLGIGLAPGREARGLVTFANTRGDPALAPVPAGTALAAGAIPFVTTTGLDVLPIELALFQKVPLADPPAELADYYRLLYASWNRPLPQPLLLYETRAVEGPADLDAGVDSALFAAILARPGPGAPVTAATLAGRFLAVGLAPDPAATMARLAPAGAEAMPEAPLVFELAAETPPAAPGAPPGVRYIPLAARVTADPLSGEAVAELAHPADPALFSPFSSLAPLEAGVGPLPPLLESPALAARLLGWIRIRPGRMRRLALLAANAALARQREQVGTERLADGDGSPGQLRELARRPVIPGSLTLRSVESGTEIGWTIVDEIATAAGELPLPGAAPAASPATAAMLDAEAGLIRFGDGMAGRRPPAGAALYASYEVSAGAAGNIGPGQIAAGPDLPPGITATNPLPFTGGADPEGTEAGDLHVRRMLSHRDRLVTADDFAAIAWRTPGVAMGRVELVPASHPDLAPGIPGTAPGAVTLIVLPAAAAAPGANRGAAPRPDRAFLAAVCRHLEPRRLVTTELLVRGPDYASLWLSVGVSVAGGFDAEATRTAVMARLAAALSPLPPPGTPLTALLGTLYGPAPDPAVRGWPLGGAVRARQLAAEAARIPGVRAVEGLVIARGEAPPAEEIPLAGLELPEIRGISVAIGDPLPLDLVRGTAPPEAPAGPTLLPVPVAPETC